MPLTLPERLRPTWRLIEETLRSWSAHDASRIGAALAYYTVFSMAPILIIAIAVAGTIFGPEAAQAQVSLQLRTLLGEVGAGAVEEMLKNAHQAGSGVVATLVGALTLLIGATSLFGELQSALNLIWNAPPPKKMGILTWLRRRFLSFAMVLVIGFLLLVSLGVSAVISGVQGVMGGLGAAPLVAQAVNVIVSLLVTSTLFALLFKVLPDVDIAWQDVRRGAFVTAVLFAIGKQLIGVYLGNSSLASAYGAAGSFAVVLVWVYYSAQLILLGAEFTQVYAHRHGSMVGKAVPAGDTPRPPQD
jgi:membrane protein